MPIFFFATRDPFRRPSSVRAHLGVHFFSTFERFYLIKPYFVVFLPIPCAFLAVAVPAKPLHAKCLDVVPSSTSILKALLNRLVTTSCLTQKIFLDIVGKPAKY